MVWGHFPPLQVPFPGQGAAKNAHFWVNMDLDGRLVPGQGNPPGNCLMGHITSQSMGKDDLGSFMPSPATYLVQWGCENGYFWVKNSHWEKNGHRDLKAALEWQNHHQTPLQQSPKTRVRGGPNVHLFDFSPVCVFKRVLKWGGRKMWVKWHLPCCCRWAG